MECSHRWGKKWKDHTALCKDCGAVALLDSNKDPFNDNTPTILKPGSEQWKALPLRERHACLEQNKERILADITAFGRTMTSRKWGLPKTTLWGLYNKSLEHKPRAAPGPAATNSKKPPLPALPPFSDSWPEATQVKWLEVYRSLLGT